jgi:hypothetical protein
MPKDPKRNIQRYKVQGGHLNEFDYQKNQTQLAADSELPFPNQPALTNPTRPKDDGKGTTEANRTAEKQKARGASKSGSKQSKAASKKPARKATTREQRKPATKKRATVKSKSRKSAGR